MNSPGLKGDKINAKPERDSFAEVRSHQASGTSNEHSRATAQACILINGGAATAVLAFLSKDKIDASIFSLVAPSLVGYAWGVFFGASMLFCMSQELAEWNRYWYFHAEKSPPDKIKRQEERGKRWLRAVTWSYYATMFCFVMSTFMLALQLG